jgi:hypothetical protein
MRTCHYREHHGQIRALVARIEAKLVTEEILADAAPVAGVVRELFGKFGMHLALEDAALYPKLLASRDAELRGTAKLFQHEMGGLKARFDAYRRRWRGPTAIAGDPHGFVADTAAVLDALKTRIAREDSDLYALYDGAVS